MRFSDFIRDQFGVVERIYDAFDLPMTDEAVAKMKWFIADNPQGKHGIHRYSPEERAAHRTGLPMSETRTMQAWRTHAYGEPREALHLDTVPIPEPGPGEIR